MSDSKDVCQVSDISSNMEEQGLSVIVTVSSRTQLKKWTSKKTSGNRLAGVVSDATGQIDFIAWNEVATNMDTLLVAGSTYKIGHVRVANTNKQYAKSSHDCQLVFDNNTTIVNVLREPFVPPIIITPIAELLKLSDREKCTVVGTITTMCPTEKLGNMVIQKSYLRDATGIVQVSLIGDTQISQCDYSVGDVVLFENTILRIFGSLHALQASTGTRCVRPTDRNYKPYLHISGQPIGADLSPVRLPAARQSLETLDNSSGRKQFSASVLAVSMATAVYDKCPRLQCRTRVLELEDSKLFRCSKCGADYLVSAKGLALTIEVGDPRAVPSSNKKVILFNETAEQFIGMSAVRLGDMDVENIKQLESTLLGVECSFVVNAGRLKDQFVCESFTKLSEAAPVSTGRPAIPSPCAKTVPLHAFPLPLLPNLSAQPFTVTSSLGRNLLTTSSPPFVMSPQLDTAEALPLHGLPLALPPHSRNVLPTLSPPFFMSPQLDTAEALPLHGLPLPLPPHSRNVLPTLSPPFVMSPQLDTAEALPLHALPLPLPPHSRNVLPTLSPPFVMSPQLDTAEALPLHALPPRHFRYRHSSSLPAILPYSSIDTSSATASSPAASSPTFVMPSHLDTAPSACKRELFPLDLSHSSKPDPIPAACSPPSKKKFTIDSILGDK